MEKKETLIHESYANLTYTAIRFAHTSYLLNDGLLTPCNAKPFLDEAFVISRIIKVEVRVISLSRRLRLITLTKTLIILDITKTESNKFFSTLNAKTWKSCFCSFTDGKQYESREVDMIILRNHALRS